MNAIKYIKKNGIKRTFYVFYHYKIDIILLKVMKPFFKNKKLKNIIMIESHNDFDSNGGTFYDYLIRNNYNKKYKIVWLLKNPLNSKLPKNVEAVNLYKPSIKKNYYRLVGKVFTYDNDCLGKCRDDQRAIYFGHGGFGLKKWKGLINLPTNIDYVALQSKKISNIMADQYGIDENDKRVKYIGFPYVDNMYDGNKGDLDKVTTNAYSKVILWMPTFRKGGGINRQDSLKIGSLGIPMIESEKSYLEVNEFLKNENSLLIIKIHPMQDLSDLKISNLSNIRVLTGKDVKELNIDNYRLMKDCDAMISDYSSAAYDFLNIDKPIAYDFSDINDYKIGLCVDNPKDFIAGRILYNESDLLCFIDDTCKGIDEYKERRKELKNTIFDYNDGNNCKRAAELLNL